MSSAPLHIGFISSSRELATRFAQALAGLAQCSYVGKPITASALEPLDVLLMLVPSPQVEDMQMLARVRATVPDKPVVLVADGIDVNVCVDLLKVGIDEVMTTSGDRLLLWRRILRAVNHKAELTLQSPVLQPLREPAEPLPAFANRRTSFRAPVPERLATFAVALIQPVPVRLQVVNISIATDNVPGGLLLQAIPGLPTPEPGAFTRGQTALLIVETAQGMASSTATVVRTPQIKSDAPFQLAVSVVFATQRDEQLVQRIWVEAQRDLAATAGADPSKMPARPAPKPKP